MLFTCCADIESYRSTYSLLGSVLWASIYQLFQSVYIMVPLDIFNALFSDILMTFKMFRVSDIRIVPHDGNFRQPHCRTLFAHSPVSG